MREGFIDHPEQNEMREAAERMVGEKLAALEIGLDLGRHPEVRERLAELGSHFEDSVDIAKIIRAIYADLRTELGLAEDAPERMMRAGVLHDIGKTGPAGERGEFHFAVRQLFVTPSRKFSPFADGRAKTVAEFIAEQAMSDAERVTAALAAQDIDASTETMIGFWRRHAKWTHDILKSDVGPDVDEGVVTIAASHHLLEGQNPAHLNLETAPPEAELLGMIDKYQAFRVRGGLTHEEALSKLRVAVDANKEHPEALRAEDHAIIGILDRHKDALEAIVSKA